MTPAGSIAAALALSLVGYAAGWLTIDGTVAAAVVGGAVFTGGAVPGAVLLGLFFVSGSLLTEMNRRAGLVPTAASRPGGTAALRAGRNARQVCANGLVAAVGAAMIPWRPTTGWAILTGALAAAQSDTWATELGARARSAPRLITTWKPVHRGVSGAVTALGTVGGIAGALATAGAGLAVGIPRDVATAGFFAGVLGMIADSVLGSTVQGRFYCDACDEETEHRRHRCGRLSRSVSGWRWLDNDGVNLLATGAGGTTAAVLSCWL